ncbi:MAG TPA: hypothetical protein VNW51_05025, partial [Mucilaginibacter sp.]|nr:hypothetical protein [Mucilaginibacter sp.]
MSASKSNTQTVKIGLFGIGLDTYWDQFEGLEDRLRGYVDMVSNKLSAYDVEIVNLGLIDNAQKAFEAGRAFKREDVELIFLYVTTYALSSTVLPVVKKAKVPVVVLNLAPEAAIDYKTFNKLNNRTQMTGEWLAYCSACPVPEIANVFERSGIPFYQITGMLNDDPHVWHEVEEWVAAAKVANAMYNNTMGVMGNYYGGMLDIYSNLTLQCATFGGHIEVIEVDELSGLRERVNEAEIDKKTETIHSWFDVQTDCPVDEIKRAARTAVALDKLVDKYDLGSLAYYHKGSGNAANEDTMSSVILGTSLLTGNHIPVAGEYEIKNVQAMK